MVKFRTDVRTISRMQELMDQWMTLHGYELELELSKNRWMQKLGDFAMAFDLDYLRKEKNDETCVFCELGGKAPTKKVLVYRFICQFEDAEGASPIVMDIEESVYDEACRTGRWEVVEKTKKRVSVPASTYPASQTRSVRGS
jgi:hypothetical protein